MNLFAEISLIWAVPLAIVAFGISAFYYLWKPNNAVFSTPIRLVLFALRGIALTIVFWLLLGILYQSSHYRTEKPLIVIALDGSASMLNYQDSLAVKNELPNQITTLENQLSVKFDVKTVTFTDEIYDSLRSDFSGKASNLSLPFSTVREAYLNRNLGGVVFISDGNYNEGFNPILESDKLSFTPIFSVAVGDTTMKRDARIVDLTVNQVAFSGNLFPVKIDLEASKLKGKNGVLSLFVNNKLVKEEQVAIRTDNFSQSFSFQPEAVGKGIQSIRATFNTNEQEYTLTNNSRVVYIEVLDSKRKIDIIAGGLHPDIGVLQAVLQKDKNTEVKVHFAKNLSAIPKSDLIVYHNPSSNLALWKELSNSNTPFLAILTAGSDPTNLNLGASGYATGKTDMVLPHLNANFVGIKFSEELAKRMKDFPPLTVAFVRNVREIGTTVLYQKIGAVTSEKPLMTIFDRGDNKAAVLYGEGIWRWKLSEYNRYQDNLVFDEFWGKLLQLLTVKKNTDKLRIFPPYLASERSDIVFRAEFYNDAFQQITTPEISFQLNDETGEKIATYTFLPQQSDYRLNLGKLKAGVYKWVSKSTFLGVKYEKKGELIVTPSTLESLSLTSNFGLMNEIAAQSNGKMFTLNEWNSLYTEIDSREDLTSVNYQELNFNNLIDYKWIFLLIIILFSAEWIIRRWVGSY